MKETMMYIPIHIDPNDRKKIERCCERILKKTLQERSTQIINDLIIKILDHIKSAEKITGKDYLDIKE